VPSSHGGQRSACLFEEGVLVLDGGVTFGTCAILPHLIKAVEAGPLHDCMPPVTFERVSRFANNAKIRLAEMPFVRRMCVGDSNELMYQSACN
jgi:hypothetical protein